MPPDLVELIDDHTVANDAVVYRRIAWEFFGVGKTFESGFTPALNQNCFHDYPLDRARELGFAGPCMSVGLSTVFEQLGVRPEAMLEQHPGYGLAALTVGDVRRLRRADDTPAPQGVLLRPTPTEPWHGVVFDASGKPRTKGVSKKLAEAARWIVPLVAP